MLIYNPEKKLFEYDNDHKESYVEKYLERRKRNPVDKEKLGKSFCEVFDAEFNETQLNIIVESLITKMEFILKEYKNFLGDAVLVFNKIKESLIIENNEIIKNGNKATTMLAYLREIGSFKSHPFLQVISMEALNIYNYYKGNFSPTENLNLKALQKTSLITSPQRIEAYNIVKEHLEEAINTIQKTHIYALAKRENRLHYTPPEPETLQTNEKKETSFVARLKNENLDNTKNSGSTSANKRALTLDGLDVGPPSKKLSSYMSGGK